MNALQSSLFCNRQAGQRENRRSYSASDSRASLHLRQQRTLLLSPARDSSLSLRLVRDERGDVVLDDLLDVRVDLRGHDTTADVLEQLRLR